MLKDSVRQAQLAILKYLLAHKNARDTVEGIEKWWLPQSRGYGMADIGAALRELEKRDVIRVWQSASAQPIYGRGPTVDRELQDYLRSLEASG
jgi:hypothetical protein